MKKRIFFALLLLSVLTVKGQYAQEEQQPKLPNFSLFFSPAHIYGYDRSYDYGIEYFLNKKNSIQAIYGHAGPHQLKQSNLRTNRFHLLFKRHLQLISEHKPASLYYGGELVYKSIRDKVASYSSPPVEQTAFRNFNTMALAGKVGYSYMPPYFPFFDVNVGIGIGKNLYTKSPQSEGCGCLIQTENELFTKPEKSTFLYLNVGLNIGLNFYKK
ncbi:hypothetical protein LAG90_14645 [Marinilongibacter aquaticus]|uniref:hypothetical protein n=1 Tax=Marinilongibacter aquaticus TaxID=2975157 RepID=UPI0021BDC9BF|nr:hypothetical protein [Marinilongibacter aquaticus]UBM58043.1 hypothetical protein LAG90_14645 [Marinilongibacter aquaticus]